MSPEQAAEEVLVVPAERVRLLGEFLGFRPVEPGDIATILEPQFLSYRPRGEVETDPSFKQLIPYLVLRCGEKIFHYRRGSSGTEKRLAAKRSVGIGGHISRQDGPTHADPYRVGMLRELHEEVVIGSAYRERMLGFIYDGRTAVGEVHLGIVHLLELETPNANPAEAGIAECGFELLDELMKSAEEFETWSQFLLQEMTTAK